MTRLPDRQRISYFPLGQMDPEMRAELLPGTSASMAPGFETAEALAETKQAADYWARH